MRTKNYCATQDISLAQQAVGVTSKYWNVGQTINIAFIEGTQDQQDFVKKTAKLWLDHANLDFNYTHDLLESDIRIAFMEGRGSWSYIGKDNLHIKKDEPTMNFGWLDQAVVLHEFGHMLGLGHEHQNPNKPIEWDIDALVADLSQPPNNWTREQIQFNIINRYDPNSVDATALDSESIMMYQIPSRWTKNNFSAGFNEELSETDVMFISAIYPETINIPDKELLTHVFQTRKELKKLKEITVVRIGALFGLPTNQKLRKRHNVDIVARHLNLK